MDFTGQYMVQTSNSLLSPIKSMVARGNQWYPRIHLHASLRTCTYLHASLCAPPHTPVCTSEHLHAPLCEHPCTPPCTLCTPLHAPLCIPLHTSMHEADWLIVPTTSNHIPAFKCLINIKS